MGDEDIVQATMKIVDNLLATADKIDHGVLLFKATAQDKTNLKHILNKGFANQKEPNYSHWVYKNRAGLDHVILWTQLDLGTMREELLFATDYDYNLIEDIVPLEFNFVNDDGEVIEDTYKPSTMQSIQDELDEIPSF